MSDVQGAAATPPSSAIEALLRRDRMLVLGSLLLVTAFAWLYLVVMARDMARGDMSLMGMGEMAATEVPASMGAAATMALMPWTTATFVLMFVMWWVMMLGMMVPSAAPMILLFARVHRKKLADQNPALRTALFTLGYGIAWAAFSVAAVLLQWGFGALALLSPMMVGTSPVLGAALFLAAGVYQLSPLKHACLRQCRSPVHFLSTHWRKGGLGALRMGLAHGAFCVGCCWFLMGLLFFGGVMNLLWVAAIAVFVLLEKVAPRGDLIGRASGVLMLGFGAYLLAGLWSGA